jgi:cytochrome b6-f complex iron-sulfur subunit
VSGRLPRRSRIDAARVQDAFVVLAAVCTHEGCTVSGCQNARYVYPCHGSQFTTSGAVAQGPASRSLQQFTTTYANNVLTIPTS